MKKQIIAVALCASMVMALFAGCGDAKTPEATTNDAVSESISAGDTVTNDESEQAYMDFLNGKSTVTTAEKFSNEESEYSSLTPGTYSFDELKSAIAELEMNEVTTKYTFLDFGKDGVSELALRFESTTQGLMNWVGFIKYNGKTLDLNHYYEDGYRTFSNLYTSGYLQTGGAISAGGNTATLSKIDRNGFATDVFTKYEYYGSFATSAAYDLTNGQNGLTDNYDDIAGSSDFMVREYLTKDTKKISVSNWNDDAAVRAREEALISDLVKLGAQQISEDEMDELCSLSPYGTEEVKWLDWNNETPTSSAAVEAVISVDYASDELLANSDNYHEFIAEESEYQVKVKLSTNAAVTDFRVLSLNIDNVTDDGEITYSSEELYALSSLTPEKPLVVGMVFAGDTPNMGISYKDGNGTKHVYSIGMSGMDGSLLLEKANLK